MKKHSGKKAESRAVQAKRGLSAKRTAAALPGSAVRTAEESEGRAAVLRVLDQAVPDFAAPLARSLEGVINEHPELLRRAPGAKPTPESQTPAASRASTAADVPGPAAQTTQRDIDLAAIMGMLGRTSAPFIAGARESLEKSGHVPHTLEETHDAGCFQVLEEAVTGQAPVAPDDPDDPEATVQPDSVPPLADLTGDLPDTGFRLEIQAMPAAVEIRRGVQLALGIVTDRVAHVEEYLAQHGFDCDDTCDDEAGIATVLARRALSEVTAQVEELRQGVVRYFVAVGWGRMVELDDRTIDKAKDVLASAPPYARARTELAVAAAVKALEGLPNRGGLLAVAEQERLAALDTKSPRLRAIQAATGKPESYFKAGWPWTDAKGNLLTAQSEYDGETGDGGKSTKADARGRRVR